MREVAHRAGVSPSTVSRVLSGTETRVPIAEATRHRVAAVADELGFRPNRLARALRGSRTGMLGLIVRDLGYPLHQSFIHGIVEAAHRMGYQVVLGSTDGLTGERAQLARILETRMVDGVVLVGGLDELPHLVDELYDAGIPVVGLGLGTSEERIPIVRSDNPAGARLAFEHLVDLGHRRLGIVVAGAHPELADRREAFLAAAHEAGLPEPHVVEASNRSSDAEHAASALLTGPDAPTAVFCTTDMVARGVLAAAHRAEVRVPAALSVVGYDDQEWARDWWPPLTTVRQDHRRMAEQAVALVVRAIDSDDRIRPFHDWIPVRLVVRGTTAPAGTVRPSRAFSTAPPRRSTGNAPGT